MDNNPWTHGRKLSIKEMKGAQSWMKKILTRNLTAIIRTQRIAWAGSQAMERQVDLNFRRPWRLHHTEADASLWQQSRSPLIPRHKERIKWGLYVWRGTASHDVAGCQTSEWKTLEWKSPPSRLTPKERRLHLHKELAPHLSPLALNFVFIT